MKLLKVVFIFFAVVLVAVVIGIYALYHYTQSNKFKDDVIVKFQEKTGRTLAIDGDISLTFYPWAGIKLKGVTLENAQGFSERPLLKAEYLAVRIKTLPLLKQHYELDTFILHGLEINFEKNADGKTNWQDLVGETEHQAGTSHNQETQPGELPHFDSVILGGVDVQNTVIRWDDDKNDKHYEIKDIKASTGALVFGEPLGLTMSYIVKANQPAIEKEVKLTATLNYDLDKEIYRIEPLHINAHIKGKNIPGGSVDTTFTASMVFDNHQETLSINELQLNALGIKAQVDMVASDVYSKQPSINGKAMVNIADMAILLKVLEIEPLASNLTKLSNRQFIINTEIQSDDSGHIEVPQIIAKGLGTDLQMTLAGKPLDAKQPTVKGKLRLNGKDLPLMMQLVGAVQGKNSAFTRAGQELTSLKEKGFTVNSEFEWDKGNIELPTLNINMLMMQMYANIQSQGKQQAAGTISLEGEDLNMLLKVLAGFQGQQSSLKDLANDLEKSKDRSFSLSSKIDVNMKKGRLEVSDLLIHLLGSEIQGNLDTQNSVSDSASVKGQVSAKGSDFPSLLRLFGSLNSNKPAVVSLGEQLSRIDDKSFNINSEFAIRQKNLDIDLKNLDADMLGIKLNAHLKASDMKGSDSSINGHVDMSIAKPKELLDIFGQPDMSKMVSTIKLKTDLKGNAKNMELTPFHFKTTLSGESILHSPVDIVLTAKTKVNLEEQQLAINDLSLSGLGLNVNAGLKLNQFLSSPSFTGRLTIAPIHLRTFMKSINKPLGETVEPKAYEKFSLDTVIKGSSQSVTFNDLTIQLDNSKLNGDITVNDFQQKALNFNISIDQINADHYSAHHETVNKKNVNDGIPFIGLLGLNLKGNIAIGSFITSNLKLENIQTKINTQDSHFSLNPIKADLYGGSYSGDMSLNLSTKTPKLTLNSNLKNVQLGPLEQDFLGSSQIEGTANLNLALSSAGKNVIDLKRLLSGNGKLEITNGVLQGIDVAKVLREVEIMIEDKRIGKPTEGGETAFESLFASLEINQGHVTNQDMVLTAPGFKVSGKGLLADLNTTTWNYDLLLSVDPTSATSGENRYNIGGYSIPATCRGLIADKRCIPDVANLLSTIFKKSLQDKLFEEIGLKKKRNDSSNSESAESSRSTDSEATKQVPSLEEVGKKLLKGLFD